MARILIVDDDLNTCQSLTAALGKEGHQIFEAHSGKEALEKIRAQEVDLAVIDLMMPGMNGLEFFQTIKALRPEVVSIMISAQATVEVAVSAIKSGIYDFITKPFRLGDIKKVISKALEAQTLLTENRRLRQALREKASFTKIIGNSPSFEKIIDLIPKVAPTRSTVLLSGESGTGKELIAEAIHFSSPRAEGPFVRINCGALTETILESELFGHKKGAFTGALVDKKGLFEAAHGGTLFLDEVEDTPLSVQVRLLRVLQAGEIRRVGDVNPIFVDVRIIAATNRDLEKEIIEGRFREDLFYRLNVINIEIPPLRERVEDITLLAHHFLNKYSKENNKKISNLSSEVGHVLSHHPWPGNVRELENILERAVSLCQTQTIELSDLPSRLTKSSYDESHLMIPIGISLDEIEQAVLEKTLLKTKGDKKAAARLLGISLSSLYNKLNRKES